MLHYFKFRQDLLDPVPGREVYIKRGKGKGWPEQCPPIRAANSFGFDLLANFDLTFIRGPFGRLRASRQDWRVRRNIVINSDFGYTASKASKFPGMPLAQQYAWFWKKGQKLPHPISDNVYAEIRNQVKISTYLFLNTDPDELLLFTAIPNLDRPWRAMTALVDTDWYPASYPWHCVIELAAGERRIKIKKGEPLCRVMPVRRDTYAARQMSQRKFADFFDSGQQWLAEHGRSEHEGTMDITHTYSRQQLKSRFVVTT